MNGIPKKFLSSILSTLRFFADFIFIFPESGVWFPVDWATQHSSTIFFRLYMNYRQIGIPYWLCPVTKNWIVGKPRGVPAQLHQRTECNVPTPLRMSSLLDHWIIPTRYVDFQISVAFSRLCEISYTVYDEDLQTQSSYSISTTMKITAVSIWRA